MVLKNKGVFFKVNITNLSLIAWMWLKKWMPVTCCAPLQEASPGAEVKLNKGGCGKTWLFLPNHQYFYSKSHYCFVSYFSTFLFLCALMCNMSKGLADKVKQVTAFNFARMLLWRFWRFGMRPSNKHWLFSHKLQACSSLLPCKISNEEDYIHLMEEK